MKDQNKGLIQKYVVKKLSNPEKEMDCLVLEFDDPISRVGIASFAKECQRNGFDLLAKDLFNKLSKYNNTIDLDTHVVVPGNGIQ